MIDYYQGLLTSILSEYIPQFIAEFLSSLAKKGFFALLDLNYEITKPYTPERYI